MKSKFKNFGNFDELKNMMKKMDKFYVKCDYFFKKSNKKNKNLTATHDGVPYLLLLSMYSLTNVPFGSTSLCLCPRQSG